MQSTIATLESFWNWWITELFFANHRSAIFFSSLSFKWSHRLAVWSILLSVLLLSLALSLSFSWTTIQHTPLYLPIYNANASFLLNIFTANLSIALPNITVQYISAINLPFNFYHYFFLHSLPTRPFKLLPFRIQSNFRPVYYLPQFLSTCPCLVPFSNWEALFLPLFL